jgi:hypothetical protein
MGHCVRVAICLVVLTACGESVVTQVIRLDDATTADCGAGGVVVRTGVDGDGDGVLDDSEVDHSTAVCNGTDGTDGATSLINVDALAPGDECRFGGHVVRTGLDDDRDGDLAEAEVDAVGYVCESRTAIAATEPETSGTRCPAGGVRMRSGLDLDQDGALDDAEVTATSFLCNGEGSVKVAVRTRSARPGEGCSGGGSALETGVDDNGDGTLSDSEVDSTSMICSGADGSDGADAGQVLIRLSAEPMGTHCPTAGTALAVGVDVNRDGALDEEEVSQTSYICNGSRSAEVRYEQRLAENPPVEGRSFGRQVALDGNVLAIGSASIAGASPAFYIYERPDSRSAWTLVASFSPPDGRPGDGIGQTLSLSGTTLAISAPGDDEAGPDAGAVYVYERLVGGWELAQKLTSGEPSLGFGSDVSVDGEVLVALGGGGNTRFHIFTRNESGEWVRWQTIPGQEGRYLGAIGISNETVVVGGGTTLPPARGSAWVYDRAPASGLWSFSQEVLPEGCCPSAPRSLTYGLPVRINENRIAVGDQGDSVHGTNSGAVFVFDRIAGVGWTQRGSLTPTVPASSTYFGYAVALGGDVVVAGSSGDETGSGSGAAHVFRVTTIGGWEEVQRLINPDPGPGGSFGLLGIGLSAEDIVVTAPYSGERLAPYAGAAHVYSLLPRGI